MRNLPPPRDPRWRWAGWGVLGLTLGVTGVQLALGPRSMASVAGLGDFDPGMRGTVGTLTELQGDNRLTLRYQTIQGEEQDLKLGGVVGELEESRGRWKFKSPEATRARGSWLLNAPLALESLDAAGGTGGQGTMEGQGGALRWSAGRWEALAPLTWHGMQGAGPGTWRLPAGWTREPEGLIRVTRGPVIWDAEGEPTIRHLEADRLEAEPGLQSGRLSEVRAQLVDGQVEAQKAELLPGSVLWPGPLRFTRLDGWNGGAEGGRAERPSPGKPVQQVELRGFLAKRMAPEGEEKLQSLGVRWTPAGLRLEGSVTWEQTLDGQRLKLQSPRVLLREGSGAELPADLDRGWARAEGQPLLTWGRRSLGAARMDLDRRSRKWRMPGPVTGRAEEGTFSAGAGQGSPRAWSFEGPVLVNFNNGGNLRGSSLVWEEAQWTLTGRPATWSRLRERLSGSRIVRKGERLEFPEGLSGALSASDGELTLRAAQGESDATEVRLTGGVEVQGQGWRLLAERVVLKLGAGRAVQTVKADGAVSLRGRLGEGQGDAMELEPAARAVRWHGRVRGLGVNGGGPGGDS
ncbi:MAG TPA: hypothetical protein VJ623_13735 [Holophagaceae bacterium]|nr:hypothetical protein [Holophagaceae bacterium]